MLLLCIADVKVTRQRCTPIKCHSQQAAHSGSSDTFLIWFLLKILRQQAVMLSDCCSQVSASPSGRGLWGTHGSWECFWYCVSDTAETHALLPTSVYKMLLHSAVRRSLTGISDIMFLCPPWPASLFQLQTSVLRGNQSAEGKQFDWTHHSSLQSQVNTHLSPFRVSLSLHGCMILIFSTCTLAALH